MNECPPSQKKNIYIIEEIISGFYRVDNGD